MRLRPTEIDQLRQIIYAVAPDAVAIRLFGSRLDDNAKGGDIDLMIDFNHPIERPALLSTRLVVAISRALQGRSVDVVLRAPNVGLDKILWDVDGNAQAQKPNGA